MTQGTSNYPFGQSIKKDKSKVTEFLTLWNNNNQKKYRSIKIFFYKYTSPVEEFIHTTSLWVFEKIALVQMFF